jgi:hypothetical protein
MECREHVRTWHACQNACVSCILIAACTCSPFKITCKACLAAHTPAKHAMRVKMPCVSYSCETCHACQNATYSGEGTCQAFAQMLITEGKHVLCCDWRCERVQIPCNQRKDCVLGLQDASLCKPHTHPPPPPPTRTHAHTHTVRVATRVLLRNIVQAPHPPSPPHTTHTLYRLPHELCCASLFKRCTPIHQESVPDTMRYLPTRRIKRAPPRP